MNAFTPSRSWVPAFSIALTLVTLTLSSCWHPAFDPDISGSEAVIRKLGSPIFEMSSDIAHGYLLEDAWFLPNAAKPITRGLLVFRDALRVYLASGSASAEASNALGDHFTLYADPTGLEKAFLASEPTQGRYIDPIHPIAPPLPAANYPPNITGTLGIGMLLESNSHARGLWLGLDTAFTPITRYATVDWNGGAPSFPGAATLFFSEYQLVAKPGKAFYCLSTGKYYLSCGLVDGSQVIYRWTDPSAQQPVRYPAEYGPLVGALSDGRLLAEDNGILTVLNADLERLFAFPAGKLRFVHERHDGTKFISVFTRTIFARDGKDHDSGQILIEAYEIPSANLHTLAE